LAHGRERRCRALGAEDIVEADDRNVVGTFNPTSVTLVIAARATSSFSATMAVEDRV